VHGGHSGDLFRHPPVNEKFGRHRVLGGTAKIQATIMPDGAIRQFNDWRTLTFGEQSGEVTERVRALAALFEVAKGVEVFAVPDIVQRMWEKLVHLSTAAAMTCLMRANVARLSVPLMAVSCFSISFAVALRLLRPMATRPARPS
jgi:ketopantoate reductase